MIEFSPAYPTAESAALPRPACSAPAGQTARRMPRARSRCCTSAWRRSATQRPWRLTRRWEGQLLAVQQCNVSTAIKFQGYTAMSVQPYDSSTAIRFQCSNAVSACRLVADRNESDSLWIKGQNQKQRGAAMHQGRLGRQVRHQAASAGSARCTPGRALQGTSGWDVDFLPPPLSGACMSAAPLHMM